MNLSQLPVCLDICLAAGCYSWMLYVKVLLEWCKAAEVRSGKLDRVQITTAPCCLVATIRGSGLRAVAPITPIPTHASPVVLKVAADIIDTHYMPQELKVTRQSTNTALSETLHDLLISLILLFCF